MMNTMYEPGITGFALFGALHFASAFALLAGVFFLLYLAAKVMTNTQLKQWGLGLTIGGVLITLLSAGGMYGGHAGMMRGHTFKAGYKNIEENQMMGGMMQGDSDDIDALNDESAMGMSMNGMTMMLEGKTGDAFDAAFLTMMIPHHQGAIDMAKLAQKNAGHTELKKMADGIITAQQSEIDQMHAWQKAWGFTK
jgi:hypothetical protein